jgi:hypothetical protein
VLAVDARGVHRRPYWERRQLLEGLELHGDHWSTTPTYADGDALVTTCPAGAAASRPITATTGDTRSRSKRLLASRRI